MPSKIVDLSVRSRIIRDEPFHVHFWEWTPSVLEKMRIDIPKAAELKLLSKTMIG